MIFIPLFPQMRIFFLIFMIVCRKLFLYLPQTRYRFNKMTTYYLHMAMTTMMGIGFMMTTTSTMGMTLRGC